MATVAMRHLVEEIAIITGQTKKRTKRTVHLLLELITGELEKGNRVELRDFGVFDVQLHQARVGRNPYANKPINIPAKNYVVFRVGKKLKRVVLETTGREA